MAVEDQKLVSQASFDQVVTNHHRCIAETRERQDVGLVLWESVNPLLDYGLQLRNFRLYVNPLMLVECHRRGIGVALDDVALDAACDLRWEDDNGLRGLKLVV